MIRRQKFYKQQSASQALVVVLLAVALLSIIIIAFLLTASLHHSVSRQDFQSQAARAMATTGLNSAITQIRTALGPWDDPYNNFCGGNATSAPPTFYWSVSPGIISRWSYASVAPQTNYPLFSVPAYGETNLVNLNAPSADGIYPIIGGANPPAIKVYWANVLQNPQYAPAATNRIVGRYAFWVDDENAKININTADGTMKYQTNSLGLGTPSEVSLQVLQSGGANISTTTSTNIVYIARTTGFNSPREILRTTGAALDLYTNNVFNLTTTSRSPDLNIFGQPKMAMMPMLEDADEQTPDNTKLLNGITLEPLREIYPTPSQLPSFPITNVTYANEWGTIPNAFTPWPLAFRQEVGLWNAGGIATARGPGAWKNNLTSGHFPWINGMLLARYLAGTNAMGQAVTWPPFSGTAAPAAGFLGKYTPRQIDSLVAQTLSYGSKTISSDYPYSSDVQGLKGYFIPAYNGRRTMVTPFQFPGWLSGQWVNGIGRTPIATTVLMKFTTQGSNLSLPTDSLHYVPPETILSIWLEFWLPAGYLGGNNVIPLTPWPSGLPIALGAGGYGNATLNMTDEATQVAANPPTPSPLPKATTVGSTTGLKSYWGNQLLTSNQGIDFQGNYPIYDDPDQGLAKQYHDPWAQYTNNPGVYYGGGKGGFPDSPFVLPALQPIAPSQDWAPGELRCLAPYYGPNSPLGMQIAANGSTLQIGGGISLTVDVGVSGTDGENVPLENFRGTDDGADLDGENWTDSAYVPGSPTTTVREHAIDSVIPVSFSMPISEAGDGSDLGYTQYVLGRVADPLVNKFPGDWMVITTNSPPVTTMPYETASESASGVGSYTEYASGFRTNLVDPDSYWLPQEDCGMSSSLADVASQTLIPRSARFPSIGYLQYLRTGIIPDDELSLPYQWPAGTVEGPKSLDQSKIQHGTPFRLLSYAPSTEMANQVTTRNSAAAGTSQTYPDWAMLDLLYVPSILYPYAGPYGYHDPNNSDKWTGYGTLGILANYSTGGGSTPGRINPNGAVIYTTNVDIPQPGITRTLPMQAVLSGLMVNQSNIANPISPTNPNPGLGGGSSVDAPDIAKAITSYIISKGAPLQMPAEICNVPAIAALRPAVNPTRNDLVRQVIGALTTQSNVFSVWAVGETVMKNPANNGYGVVETGDSVLAESRFHCVVERYLDPGADDIHGNTANAGTDGTVGTYDDPVDSNLHPYCPHYLYRVIWAEEIR